MRRVLITGGASGIGAAAVARFQEDGCRVAALDVDEAMLAQCGADVRAVCDVSDDASVDRAVEQAVAELGGLDVVVAAAGVASSGSVVECTPREFGRVMSVNVRGTWLATVAAQPHLAAGGSGRVVNLASDTALWGAPNLMAYVASKGAVMAMTRSMARELGPQGITVNAIAPGLTLVEATQYVPQARHDHYRNGRAIERAQMPEDVTEAVLFLLSRGSGFITGQVLPINGGFVMN